MMTAELNAIQMGMMVAAEALYLGLGWVAETGVGSGDWEPSDLSSGSMEGRFSSKVLLELEDMTKERRRREKDNWCIKAGGGYWNERPASYS
jgi:hypothetical protein